MPPPPPPPCSHSSPPHSWTLTALVGSYLDLVLAYLLLMGSTLVFLASKFLSFLGLALPCPCGPNGGFFGHPDCFQALLLGSTRGRIESLHGAIRSRFPFDVLLDEAVGSEPDGTPPLRLTGPEGDDVGAEAAAVVVADRMGPAVGRRIRRRRVVNSRKEKSAAVAPMRLSWQLEGLGDNFGSNDIKSKEESFEGVASGDRQRVVEDRDSMVVGASPATEYFSGVDMSPAIHATDGDTELIIKNLERELEEAQAAHAALYIELEKERSAAATAADEAMAMILRLQSEKAAVEMESRQYQRMIEEKSAYDEEEMDILKEIIVRREREKHVLEKEVEAYRKMILSGEITVEKPDTLFGSPDEPTSMLKTIFESIGKKENVDNDKKWAHDGITFPKFPDLEDESNMEFQEKGILMDGDYSSGYCQSCAFGEAATPYKLDKAKELEFSQGPLYLGGREGVESESKIERRIPIYESNREDDDRNQGDTASSQTEFESSVLDVHVIEHALGTEKIGKASSTNVVSSEIAGKDGETDEFPQTTNIDLSVETSATDWVQGEQDIQSNLSHGANRNEQVDASSNNAAHLDMRRSSMPAVDSERFKLESEVESLRKRLKTIQQGRENLGFSAEYRERETFQLQLLEKIACQLQEIRKLTEPGRKTRQASLLPASSKVNSKKRRCRSVFWGLHGSA